MDPQATPSTTADATLHALQADCLGGDGVVPSSGLSTAFERDFGSVGDALAALTAAMHAAGMAGHRWTLLCWSSPHGRLQVCGAGDDARLPAGATPVLALDAAAAGVDELMRRIDWHKVYRRYGAAVAADASSCTFQAGDADRPIDAQVLDVRRPEHVANAKDTIAGAAWCDPGRVDQWVERIDRSRPVLVACVHGLDIGRSTALALRARGVDARYLAGGVEGWREAGLPMQPRDGDS